ncbi:MAG: hypothetical protein ABI596_09100 [Pyrinomonadaceae bacterium]
MNKSFLRQLAENPDFISGIHNYCDRWCERCPFTARCVVYATEKADEEMDSEVHDINSAKFWQKLGDTFKEAGEMLAEWAAEAGIDLEAIDVEKEMERNRADRDRAAADELSLLARNYADHVQSWFEEQFRVERKVHDDNGRAIDSLEEDVSILDAVEVIRWYEFFIAAKIMRAVMGSYDDDVEMSGEEDIFAGENILGSKDYEAEALAIVQDDADGSAKVALIAINRSASAWRMLQRSLAEKSDSIMPLLAELERLRLLTEATFPRAHDFIRPGFDEEASRFIS